MKLISQYNIAVKNLSKLELTAKSIGQIQVQGVLNARNAALELFSIPLLNRLAANLLTILPYVDENVVTVSPTLWGQINDAAQKLTIKTTLLIEVLAPIVTQEEDNTIYLRIPDYPSLKETSHFLNRFIKSFDQIFPSKFQAHFDFGFQGVEKGSSWLILKVLLNGISKENIETAKLFLEIILILLTFYEKSEAMEKFVSELQPFGGDVVKKQEEVFKLIRDRDVEELVEQLTALVPLKEGQVLDHEDKLRMGKGTLQVGKILKEETEIEISGLLQEQSGETVKLAIEKMKIIKKREVHLLPSVKDDE